MQTQSAAKQHEQIIGTVEGAALITDALNDGSAHATELRQFALETAALFRSGAEQRALGHYIDLLNGFDWLVKALDCTGEALALDFAREQVGGGTLSRFVDDLNALLQETMKAQERKDWVLLADLIEYELAPHLEQWRTVFVSLREKV
ncbi:MAG: hypothetical protein ED859_15485 [Desulfuromonadales bacterium]|nr:MAG: hypothetical protein ED859_15485 [Desulfuromonadales bacterium]